MVRMAETTEELLKHTKEAEKCERIVFTHEAVEGSWTVDLNRILARKQAKGLELVPKDRFERKNE